VPPGRVCVRTVSGAPVASRANEWRSVHLTTIEYGGHTWRVELKVVHAGERGWMRFSFVRPEPDGGEVRLVMSVDPTTFSNDPDQGTRLTEDWLRERLAQALEGSLALGAGRSADQPST
jgi:hypothetical protein